MESSSEVPQAENKPSNKHPLRQHKKGPLTKLDFQRCITGYCARIFGTDFGPPAYNWRDVTLDDIYTAIAPFFLIFGTENENDIQVSEESFRAIIGMRNHQRPKSVDGYQLVEGQPKKLCKAILCTKDYMFYDLLSWAHDQPKNGKGELLSLGFT
jgi:hypothetical protein